MFAAVVPPGRRPRGNGQYRIPVQVGGSGAKDQVAGAGAQGRYAHPGDPGQATRGGGHERRRGFVAGQDEPNASAFERVDQLQHFPAGMPKGEADAGVMQGVCDDRRTGWARVQSVVLGSGPSIRI